MQTRTDARNVTASYLYEGLNRVSTINYSDGLTSAVTYSYDIGPNGKGHLTGVANGNSMTKYAAFDAAGNVLPGHQAIRRVQWSPKDIPPDALSPQLWMAPTGRIV